MDLKDVVNKVFESATEAQNAYHAGHPDDSERYLKDVQNLIGGYFSMPATPADDVTGSADAESPAEEQPAKPAQVPAAQAQPGAVDPAVAAQQIGGSLTDEKPNL